MTTAFSAPQWETHKDDVCCPLCDYNLRGLTEPICPECGYRFDWSELLDPKRRAHAFLFEHHPERNAWSFGTTLLAGLHAATFWRAIYPTQPSRPRRLLIYAAITCLPLIVMWIGYAIAMTELGFARYKAILARTFHVAGPGIIHLPMISFLRIQVIFQNAMRYEVLLSLGLAVIVWPWLTLAGLMVFRWSMKRAKMNRVHVMRCLIYSTDLLLLAFPFYGWLVAEACGFDNRFFIPPTTLAKLWIAAAAILLVAFSYRLICAYRFYLRFDHAIATVLAAQTMAALAVCKLLFVLQGY